MPLILQRQEPLAQSAGAAQYTDCIYAEVLDPPTSVQFGLVGFFV